METNHLSLEPSGSSRLEEGPYSPAQLGSQLGDRKAGAEVPREAPVATSRKQMLLLEARGPAKKFFGNFMYFYIHTYMSVYIYIWFGKC